MNRQKETIKRLHNLISQRSQKVDYKYNNNVGCQYMDGNKIRHVTIY